MEDLQGDKLITFVQRSRLCVHGAKMPIFCPHTIIVMYCKRGIRGLVEHGTV